jgi:GT2 family glycosyltransferase
MTRTVAVVVHWRDLDETLGCVRSLAAEPGVDVIVVDNGSGDDAARRLAAEGPDVRCLTSPENRGYAGGGNLGIRAALETGASVVLLINNDARIVPGAMAAAARALADDPSIAVVGAKILRRDDPSRLWLAWGDLTYRQSLVALHGADVPDGPEWSRRRDVDWVSGCAMWFARAALEVVGLLDEDFFAYQEEVEWCLRARRLGWRVVYAPEAQVIHAGQGTSPDPRAIRIRKYFAARNAVLLARRHATFAEGAKLAAFLGLSLPAELCWHALRGRAGEVGWKVAGVRDGLLGRRPPFEALGLR